MRENQVSYRGITKIRATAVRSRVNNAAELIDFKLSTPWPFGASFLIQFCFATLTEFFIYRAS